MVVSTCGGGEIKLADDRQIAIDAWANKHDCDVIAYFGDMVRGEDTYLIRKFRTTRRRKHALLLLATRGGDPNAAYRIARAVQRAYRTVQGKHEGGQAIKGEEKLGDFLIFIDGVCKSAGTLLCLGADKLIMSENAELGPIRRTSQKAR